MHLKMSTYKNINELYPEIEHLANENSVIADNVINNNKLNG